MSQSCQQTIEPMGIQYRIQNHVWHAVFGLLVNLPWTNNHFDDVCTGTIKLSEKKSIFSYDLTCFYLEAFRPKLFISQES